MVTNAKNRCIGVESTQKHKWMYVSAATNHICTSRESFESFKPQFGWVKVGNRERVWPLGTGNVRVHKLVDGHSHNVVLTDVTYAPEMMVNLISKSRVKKAGFIIVADSNNQSPSKGITRIVHKTSEITTMICVEIKEGLNEAVMTVETACVTKTEEDDLWNKLLCHVSPHKISRTHQMVAGIPKFLPRSDYECDCCKIAKYTRKSRLTLREIRTISTLERVSSDVVGPIRDELIDGSKYFATLQDEYSGYSLVRFTKCRSILGTRIIEMIREIQSIYSCK